MNLRQSKAGLVFLSDRSSRDVRACCDNAVVERFFWSLKQNWILKTALSIRVYMKQYLANCMKYYNPDRLHTANGNMSPIKYEISQKKISG